MNHATAPLWQLEDLLRRNPGRRIFCSACRDEITSSLVCVVAGPDGNVPMCSWCRRILHPQPMVPR